MCVFVVVVQDHGPSPMQRLPTTICDLNKIATLVAACACPECGQTTVQLSSEASKSKGIAVHLTVACSNCGHTIAENYTSSVIKGENTYR